MKRMKTGLAAVLFACLVAGCAQSPLSGAFFNRAQAAIDWLADEGQKITGRLEGIADPARLAAFDAEILAKRAELQSAVAQGEMSAGQVEATVAAFIADLEARAQTLAVVAEGVR